MMLMIDAMIILNGEINNDCSHEHEILYLHTLMFLNDKTCECLVNTFHNNTIPYIKILVVKCDIKIAVKCNKLIEIVMYEIQQLMNDIILHNYPTIIILNNNIIP